MIPIRCFSCGEILGDKEKKYKDLIKDGKTENEALNELKIEKQCCRTIILTNVDII